jgi:hypothetical protein
MIEIVRHLDSDHLSRNLPVFGTEEFLAAKNPDYGWFVSEHFALPFIVDTRLGFKRLVFTTEAISLQGPRSPQDERQFLDEVVDACRRKHIRVDFIATPQANAVFREIPSQSESVEWGSFTVDLTRPETAIFDSFHRYHRSAIRHASSEGVEISQTGNIETIYQILRDTMVRQHLLFFPSQSYLSELQRRLGENISFYIASHKSTVQGAAVIVHNHLGAFYYYGGSIDQPFKGSMNLMQYEIIKHLKQKNIPVYDLMGARIITGGDSKIEGIQRFKSRFASGMRKGHSFRYVVNPLRHRMFVMAVKSFFALKGSHYDGDVIDQAREHQPQMAASALENPAPSYNPQLNRQELDSKSS